MVDAFISGVLLHPLGIYVIALSAAFTIPLFDRAHRALAVTVFMGALVYMTLISGAGLLAIIQGAPSVDILTAGVEPPFSINLRFGLYEAGVVLAVNTVALLAAWHALGSLKEHAAALVLFVVMVMGINGMVMTRDLFNLFIFIEITSIATYALIGMERTAAGLAAGFKYIVATSIATTFFLLGTIFIYHQTGTLNIDDILARQGTLGGVIGFTAGIFLLTSLLIELKPYPANGWGLDVYETAPGAVAALISVGVSAGMFFGVYKLSWLLGEHLISLAVVGGLTFLISNLIGLKQDNARRLLGYSSIGQMGLLLMTLALLLELDDGTWLALIVGGLFVNHLLAKAGLFWLAERVGQHSLRDWSTIAARPGLLVLLGALLAALVGLPPFPGFWAKWQLVMLLGEESQYQWILLVLLGSLLEAAYLFRWFGHACRVDAARPTTVVGWLDAAPVAVAALLLVATGFGMALWMDFPVREMFIPLLIGALLWLVDALPGRIKAVLMLALVAAGAYWVAQDLQGMRVLFAVLLVGGGLLVAVATLYRGDARAGFHALFAVLLLSLAGLVRAEDSLAFFFSWELMTVSSYLLLMRGRAGVQAGLAYLLFSLAAAYFILTGFALHYAATGSTALATLGASGELSALVFGLLAVGFVIKMGGLGAHIWLPDTYAEAEDDFSALLSAVISKAAVFGLVLVAAHLGIASGVGFNPAYVLGWIGILTATFGALLAVFQEDIKRLVAYSSMGQLGYVVTGVALMSHLGWVSALYMTVNHFLFKGILFLSVAGIVLRTNQRLMYKMGGLIKNMPVTFVLVMIAIIAMSGVPPLTGFGGKWMLFNALIEKGWYWIAALAFFSSAVAFLYMFRLLQTVFLGQRKLEHAELREAPLILLLPQVLMVAVIMVLSAYPKLLLDRLSAAIDPWIANTLVWDGLALQTAIGYWNAPAIMAVVGGVWMVPLIILLLVSLTLKIQKVEQFNIVYAAERPHRPEDTHFAYNFFAHYDRALGFLVRPRATAFWSWVADGSHTLGASLRIFYNGNGQTYALFVLMYFVAMFVLNGGLVL